MYPGVTVSGFGSRTPTWECAPPYPRRKCALEGTQAGNPPGEAGHDKGWRKGPGPREKMQRGTKEGPGPGK